MMNENLSKEETLQKIQQQIANNPILLYMKGTPQFPQCGFSARAVQVLGECEQRFSYLNILENPSIRSVLPDYAKWPTFPQLYVDGQLVGGSDIIAEMHSKGELKPLLEEANSKRKSATVNTPPPEK